GGPSTNRRAVPRRRSRRRRPGRSLEVLREVLRELERGGRLLVVDLLAVRVAERVALGGDALLLGGLGLRGRLGGVAADAAAPAGLVLGGLLGAAPLAPRSHAGHAGQARRPTLGEGLHHLPGLEEAVDEAVHVGDLTSGAARDAGPPRAVDHLRVGA